MLDYLNYAALSIVLFLIIVTFIGLIKKMGVWKLTFHHLFYKYLEALNSSFYQCIFLSEEADHRVLFCHLSVMNLHLLYIKTDKLIILLKYRFSLYGHL